MPIDEPDTPFARSPLPTDSEDDSHAPRLTFFPHGEPTQAQEEKDDDSEGAKRAFRQKRKEHYNEIKMARELNSRKLSEDALSEDDNNK